jgi:GlpG protein
MIKALSLEIELNLLEFSKFLRAQGILHQISEESGRQVIRVGSETDAQLVQEAIKDWRFDDSSSQRKVSFDPVFAIFQLGKNGARFGRQIRLSFISTPITVLLFAISLLVALVSQLGSEAYRVDYLFYPLIAVNGLGPLLGDIGSLSLFLQTLTPMFLHFGLLHLVFNMLWLWYFGKQLEVAQPSWLFLLVIVVTSFVANTTQYLVINYNNFGGMSGVVYGLVGYAWVIQLLVPRSGVVLNSSMFGFFVAALVIMEIVASSWIATAAHVGGLVSGLVLGLIVAASFRLRASS